MLLIEHRLSKSHSKYRTHATEVTWEIFCLQVTEAITTIKALRRSKAHLEKDNKRMKREITYLELGENETQQGARVLFSNCINHLQNVEALLLEGDVAAALRYIKATVEEEE